MSRTALAWAWTAAVFAACSIPGLTLPHAPLLSADKLAHLASFAVWAVLWARARPGAPWTVAVWGLAFGTWIEVWQTLAPLGRTGEWADLAADGVGLALGLAGARTARRGR